MLKFVKLMAKTNEVEAEVYAAINLEYSSLFYLEDEHKNYVYEIAASKGYGAYEGVVYTSYILIGDNLEPTIMILASGEIANDITSGILEIERLYEDGAWLNLYPTRGFNSISMEFDFIEPEEIPSYI